MANIICIVCPKGCRLTVDENTLAVTGNGCPRGAEYGKNELTHRACGGRGYLPLPGENRGQRAQGENVCRDGRAGRRMPARACALRRRGAGGRVRHGRGRRGHAGAAGGGIREKIKKGRGLGPSLFACRKPLAGRAVQKKDNADDEKSL